MLVVSALWLVHIKYDMHGLIEIFCWNFSSSCKLMDKTN